MTAALLAGMGIARANFYIEPWLVVGVSLLVIVSLRKRNAMTLALLLIAGACIGCWRGEVYMQRLQRYDQFFGRKVQLIAQADVEGVYNSHSQFAFTATNVIAGGTRLPGTMYVTGFGVPAVYRGDELTMTGKLRPGFGPYQASMNYGSLGLIAHHQSLIDTIRLKFAAGIQSALPEPLVSFGLGLLIGQRNTLPKLISAQLLMVGLTHIIAVSGYNLTILLRAAKRLFSRGSKFQTAAASIAFVGIFLLFTGSSPSIVRAAIISLLSIAAWYYGRAIKPLVLILVAAAITGYANPLYVWGNASWYLSFLASYGVLVIAPLVRARLSERVRDAPLTLVALESLCAEAMTLPYILYTFGQMSFIGLVANVLVVTLIPLAMLLSFIAGVAGMLITPIAGWFAWPARVLLTYMLDVANLLSRIPHVFMQRLGLSVAGMLLLYGAIVYVTRVLWRKNGANYVMITDRKELNA